MIVPLVAAAIISGIASVIGGALASSAASKQAGATAQSAAATARNALAGTQPGQGSKMNLGAGQTTPMLQSGEEKKKRLGGDLTGSGYMGL